MGAWYRKTRAKDKKYKKRRKKARKSSLSSISPGYYIPLGPMPLK